MRKPPKKCDVCKAISPNHRPGCGVQELLTRLSRRDAENIEARREPVMRGIAAQAAGDAEGATRAHVDWLNACETQRARGLTQEQQVEQLEAVGAIPSLDARRQECADLEARLRNLQQRAAEGTYVDPRHFHRLGERWRRAKYPSVVDLFPKLHDRGVLSRTTLLREAAKARTAKNKRARSAAKARINRWSASAGNDPDAEHRAEVERMWRTTRLSERAIAARRRISSRRVARILGPKELRAPRPD